MRLSASWLLLAITFASCGAADERGSGGSASLTYPSPAVVSDARLPPPEQGVVSGVSLPPGSVIGDRYWVSDENVDEAGELWRSLALQYESTGLWPLLVQNFVGSPRPWLDEDYYVPSLLSDVEAADALQVANELWDDAPIDDSLRTPVGSQISRLAEARSTAAPPLEIGKYRQLRLLLVPVSRPADAVAAIGWSPTGTPAWAWSALLRSWEDRFDWYVYLLGPDTMEIRIGESDFESESMHLVAAEVYGAAPGVRADEEVPLTAFSPTVAGPGSLLFWWD